MKWIQQFTTRFSLSTNTFCPPSPALFLGGSKVVLKRIPLLNNYPFRCNCMTIYGLPHLFLPGCKMLITSKISICALKVDS